MFFIFRRWHLITRTIFGLQYFLDDRKAALSLMDALNRSCRLKSKRDNGSVTNGTKLGLPQLGWRFSWQRTHHPSPQ
ncbi:hypothetical protein B9H69_22865 [Salmonella enterica subsp. enterica serovar Poona]|nr:hypothetical protein [Salmonella enterica subsp. enterica serovar Poona]EEA0256404.1 hypothetical protein [Salmonella enterica subsp. enterica serovar Infantis]EEB7890330.1 hypothetical protein [Salmonella enterica subsp. enterica serovar Poona]EEF2249728.1 hypothetical protein [Salmonella enterica subsp. enterica serovar Infantis]HAE3757796.1 hypothetical protein [Salmonella enterica subsp. enterica serovar Carrau]